jgi:hypothetical protein
VSSQPFEPAPEPSEPPSNVTSFPTRLAKAIDRTTQQVLDAGTALRNMLLPEPPRSSLCQALATAGYDVREEQLVHRFNDKYVSHVHAVRAPGGGAVVFVAHILSEILDVKSEENQKAIVYLEYLFPARSSLTVLSRGLPDPEGAYLQMLERWGSRPDGVTAHFVSWRRVEELEEAGYPAEDVARELKIREALGVAPAAAGGNGGQTGSISDHEEEIAGILEEQARSLPAGSAEYFKSLIGRLPSKWIDQLKGLEAGDTRSAAAAFVKWALSKGELPGRPGTTMIGLLMAELSEDVGAKQQAGLLELIEEYKLLPADEVAKRRSGR